MILLKLADLCCMCCGLSDRLQLSVILVLTCLYLNATVCGFLHPDISFETHIVEVPVYEDTSTKEIVPMGATGTVIANYNNLAEKDEAEDYKLNMAGDEKSTDTT